MIRAIAREAVIILCAAALAVNYALTGQTADIVVAIAIAVGIVVEAGVSRRRK